MVDVFHDPPGGGARDVQAAAAAERRRILINSGTERISTVRASPRGAPFHARSPVPCLCDARIDPRGWLIMYPCSFSAGTCVPMRAGRFLCMSEVRPHRGAASGGERRSHGAARSIAAPQAARGRAQAPPSGRSRARCFARGASPPADRRSCALRCTRTCAGEAAARRGWPPLWWVLSCAMYGAARHPCVENMREVWSRGVVVSLRDFYFACYNI